MRTFDGKVAVITGAGSGIGRALAVRAASRWSRRVDFADAAVLITGGGRGLGLAMGALLVLRH